jgi:hypothetical protein
MSQEILALWKPLAPTPLLWLAVTLAAYTVPNGCSALAGARFWQIRC